MFQIKETAKGYKATLKDSTDTYFIGNVKPTKGYPHNAKYPYTARISLIKENKFYPLHVSNPNDRTIYSAIIPQLCAHIQRQKDIEQSIKEDEQRQFDLLEQDVNDL